MFRPLHSLVTIVPDKAADKTAGGLVLPTSFKNDFMTGIVRRIGPGRAVDTAAGVAHMDGPDLKPGDRVVLMVRHRQVGKDQYAPIPYPDFDDNGVTVILCNFDDIVGIIEPDLGIAQA